MEIHESTKEQSDVMSSLASELQPILRKYSHTIIYSVLLHFICAVIETDGNPDKLRSRTIYFLRTFKSLLREENVRS